MQALDGWALAVTVIGVALSAAVGLGFLVQAVVRQIMDQIGAESERTQSHVDLRFGEAEMRRTEATALWHERLRDRDERIADIAKRVEHARNEHPELRTALADVMKRFERHQLEIARDYVSREVWMEHVGALNIKLDRLYEALPKKGD